MQRQHRGARHIERLLPLVDRLISGRFLPSWGGVAGLVDPAERNA